MGNTDNERQQLICQDKAVDDTDSLDNKVKTGTIIMLLGVQFLMTCVDYMPVPFLPKEGGIRGLNEIQMGIIIGSYELAKTLVSPFCDKIIAKYTARRALVGGATVCGVCSICFGMTGYTRGWVMFSLTIALRMISGACAALNNVSTASIVLKSKSYNITKLFGWLDMSIVLGFAGGYFVGGIFYKFLGFEMTFVAVGITIVLSAFLLWIVTPDICEDGEGESYFDMLRLPGVLMMFCVCVVEEMCVIASLTMLSLWLTQTYNIEVANIGFIYAVWPATYVLFTPLSVWVTEKGFVCSTVMISLLCLASVYFFLCPSPLLLEIFPHYNQPLWLVIVLLAILGIVIAFLLTPLFQSALNIAVLNGYEEDNMHTFAKLCGIFISGLSFGSMLGPPLSGAITQTQGYPWLLTILAIECLLTFIVFTTYLIYMQAAGRQLVKRQ